MPSIRKTKEALINSPKPVGMTGVRNFRKNGYKDPVRGDRIFDNCSDVV